MNKLITPIPVNPDYETKPFKLLLNALIALSHILRNL